MPKLIIICGLPATGKTTIANKLANNLRILYLQKDQIKEKLYDSLDMSTLEDSKKIGRVSMELLTYLAEEQLKNGVDLIIEAPFMFEEDANLFKLWESKYLLDVYTVICTIGSGERVARFSNRERHHAHHDNERSLVGNELEAVENPNTIYASFPGKHIVISTDKPVDELVESIKNQF
jgi:predicted kinase